MAGEGEGKKRGVGVEVRIISVKFHSTIFQYLQRRGCLLGRGTEEKRGVKFLTSCSSIICRKLGRMGRLLLQGFFLKGVFLAEGRGAKVLLVMKWPLDHHGIAMRAPWT